MAVASCEADMLETLLGGALGGLLRLAPEVLKWLDRKNERAHELRKLEAEMEFAKLRGEIALRETEATMTVHELDAMAVALREQGETAKAAGKFVAAISALVRPMVTYWFVILYSAYKIASMNLAFVQGATWNQVLIQGWTQDDMGMLMLVLTFWFVGRVWERGQRSAS